LALPAPRRADFDDFLSEDRAFLVLFLTVRRGVLVDRRAVFSD